MVEEENNNKVTYDRKSDDELKTLAKDLYKGRIFTNRHINRIEDVDRVFLILQIIEKEELRYLFEEIKCDLLYEYLDKAINSINSLSIFKPT